ncbi:MAG: SpoIID/LytB domain-containing protein [bacterium]|nr:SpoIID/LytB domain-containing protein [bacterium]
MERVRIGFLHQREDVQLRLPAGTRAWSDGRDWPLSGDWRLACSATRTGQIQQAIKVLECADLPLAEEAADQLRRAGLAVELRAHARGAAWPLATAPATWLLALPLGEPCAAQPGEHMLREQPWPGDDPLLERVRRALGDLPTRTAGIDPPLWHLQAPARCRWTVLAAEGTLALCDKDGRRVEAAGPLRFLVPQGEAARVGEVRVGIGFHWDHRETLAYEDTLEAWIEPSGRIGLINELDLERYLASVNSSEMTADSPPDLLRAQTVAARSTLLATRGRHHAGEPFDICADDHCQCFRGCGAIAAASDEAAQDTRGVVLTHAGRVCDARYSKSCGGIVEAYEHVWEDQAVPYLPSFRDTCVPDPGFVRPASEEAWRDWILAAESVWCNTEEFKLPPGLAFSDGFYRWRVELTRDEAAAHIRRTTGKAFRRLLDLTPLERGASGRLRRLLVRTDAGDFTLGKELAIRLALSATCLYSAAIVLDWEGDTLLIRGKGWGHGVGLCQLGATRMALEGRPWREILAHYYPHTALVAIRQAEAP